MCQLCLPLSSQQASSEQITTVEMCQRLGLRAAVSLPPLHQNPPHCLEITPPSSEKLVSVMRLSDLSTEDDDSGHCKMNRYDKKIDSLMNAVGCLKSEVRELMGQAVGTLRTSGLACGCLPQAACLWVSCPPQQAFPGRLFGAAHGQLRFPPC